MIISDNIIFFNQNKRYNRSFLPCTELKINTLEDIKMDEQFIRDRISSLRQEKQISERKMSLDLGHSTSYIRSITSGRALPSMSEFLYICEYLGVTPMEFFNEERKTTLTQQEAIEHIYSMSDEDIRLLIGFIERMKTGGK